MITRRTCIKGIWGAVAALHAELLSPVSEFVCGIDAWCPDERPSLDFPPKISLQRIQLECANLDEIESFYGKTLGLASKRNCDGNVEVVIGDCVLAFVKAKAGTEPFCHFAFNVSRNKFSEAKQWVASKTDIVMAPDGRDQFHFSSRDADAVYFLDPAGNLVEFIAHHRLDNERQGDFSSDDIQGVCEIGIVVGNLNESLATIKTEFDAVPYLPPASDEFAAVGDERGFLIVVKKERLWFPQRQRPATPFETTVHMTGFERKTVLLEESLTTFEVIQ